MITLFLRGNFSGHNITDTADLHQHGHITVLLFLLTIKNYRIQDATFNEVDSKCETDSFSQLQIREKHQVVGRHMA